MFECLIAVYFQQYEPTSVSLVTTLIEQDNLVYVSSFMKYFWSMKCSLLSFCKKNIVTDSLEFKHSQTPVKTTEAI